MNKIYKMSKRKFFLVYMLIDTFFAGIGMGVPFLCILLGFPVGWYIAKHSALNEKDVSTILNEILKYSLYTALFTFILMLGIWVPLSTMLLNPGADFVNTGIPMILYDPKMSFIGWMILMIFISPLLQLFSTVFASNVALWRLFKKEDSIMGKKWMKIVEGDNLKEGDNLDKKSGIVLKILSIFESGLFLKILSVFVTGLWIAGLILGNVYIILLAIILLIALCAVLYIHRDNLQEIFQKDSSVVVEDERTQLINEKAATMTFGIFVAVIIYAGIILIALRDSYPQLLQAGYTLIIAAVFCFILYFTSRAYYNRKF